MSALQSPNVHIGSSEYQAILDDIDYLYANTSEMSKTLKEAVDLSIQYRPEKLTQIRIDHTQQFHKIREYKRVLRELSVTRNNFEKSKTDIRDYLKTLDMLEVQTAANLGLATQVK